MNPALAIILARGGSKGLPRKNVLPLAGRPCIEWTLEHAFAAKTVGPILLSTDDPEILTIGRAWSERTHGRVMPMARPADLASDTATVDAAARSALTEFERTTGQAPSPVGHRLSPSTAVVVLYGNVPVRPEGLIDRAVTMLRETGADSVQSYAPVGKNHPWWMARVDPTSGAVRPWEGDVLNHGVFRRQDLPPAHVPDGGVIAVTREALMLQIAGVKPGPHAFFGREDRRRGVVNAEGAVVDIDGRIDLLVAEAMLSSQAAPRSSGSGGGSGGMPCR
jgi:N-acylneuraminate cytidylyltransferase